jgi:3,4-dihydroxy 2-butanone 4-phosphate synthase / GTP cyclohydrolase II
MDSLIKKTFYSVEEVLKDVKDGKLIIIVDDSSADNEGVFFQAAQKAQQESVNFFNNHGKSFIYLPCEQERFVNLAIPANTISIDASAKKGSGASAADKVLAITSFVNPNSKPSDFIVPGHIFPVKSQAGGVLVRAGHTEAAVDLSRIAGLYPAGIICEIIKDDGEIARLTDLMELAEKFGLKIITIEELIRYRKLKEVLIERCSEIALPTKWGAFKTITYRALINSETHIAFVKGEIKDKPDVPVRVHSQCLTGDTFGSQRCDCGEQLDAAFNLINKKGYGVILYMAQEGRGIGLCNKMKAYELQDKGFDTVEANIELGFEADMRDYGIGAQILSDLGLTTIQLLTNNPKKIVGLQGYGIKITKILPIIIEPNENNIRYLKTKKAKLNHMLDFEKKEQ